MDTASRRWVEQLSPGHPRRGEAVARLQEGLRRVAVHELTHQMRGTADQRQVDNAKVALAHNVGLGGACVTTIYKRA